MMDVIMAMLAWLLFFLWRKRLEQGFVDLEFLQDSNFWLGLTGVPLFWFVFYYIFDKYDDIYRLSRLTVLTRTLLLSLIGVTVLFFAIILDDFVLDYKVYYKLYYRLFLLHFGLTALSRMVILSRASRRLKTRQVGYRTLMIGGDKSALHLYEDLESRKNSLGQRFVGFISVNGKTQRHLKKHLPQLGKIPDLERIMQEKHIEEVIIAIETSEHDRIREIMNILYSFDSSILVKIIPDMYDIMLGTVKMTHVYGAVLIEIERELISPWQAIIKRLLDIVISSLALIILSPILLFVAIRVRMDSPGPLLYSQERIGLNGKAFEIFKFRSMYTDAEAQGPQLSSESDNRITPWGKVIRKWRLDELPQFYNVLIGEMSLVGPRPERQFYIDQISQRAPHVKHLLKVKPGITSWGQVKYGYASNVDQMIQRLKFDILYIENMSLALDIKIMFYTVLVLLQGRGK